MKKFMSNLLLVLVLVAGLSLLLYPTFADLWNSMHQSRAIAPYSDTVAGLDKISYDSVWEAVREYNRTLVGRDISRFFMTDEERAEYESLLDVTDVGVIGYIEIPKLGEKMPIYHGTSEGVLQVAIGHLEGSSLPVGGKGSHCALSGHRGLPSARLFTDLDQIVIGDLFHLYILDEVLTYQVDQIETVLPEDVSLLEIDPERDLCTLITCTPYGVNSHRLLVRGHRTITPEEEKTVHITNGARQIQREYVALIVAAPLILIMLPVLLIAARRKYRG